MIKPEVFDGLEIFKGADFSQDIEFVGVDLTGCAVKSELRAKQDFTSELLFAFTVTVIDALTGKINLFVDKALTSPLAKKVGYFSVIVTDANGLDQIFMLGSIAITNQPTEVV